MIVQEKNVRGGIAAVTAAYYGSKLEKDFDVTYVESFCDGSKLKKIRKEIAAIFAFSRVLRTKHPALVHMHTSFGGSFYRSLYCSDGLLEKDLFLCDSGRKDGGDRELRPLDPFCEKQTLPSPASLSGRFF